MAQQTMPDTMGLYEAATKRMQALLAGVKPEQMSAQTPCSEWKVKDLIDHVVGGTGFTLKAFTGSEWKGATSGSPVDDYEKGVAAVLAEARKPGMLEKQVASPMGEMPAGQFLGMQFMDVVIHSWDLAKATGQDTTLDPKLMEASRAVLEPAMDYARKAGAFGPAVSVPATARAQDRFIAWTGRRP